MKKILSILSIGIVGLLEAQQLPQYSQYIRNQFMYNPGAAGIYDFKNITLSSRFAYLGLENAPTTYYASFDMPLGLKSGSKEVYDPGLRTASGIAKNPDPQTGKFKHGVGGSLIYDSYGAFQRTSLSGTYAVHIPISKEINMSFGAKVAFSNNAFIASRAQVLNPTMDQTYIDFTQNMKNLNRLDLGAGLYIYSRKFFVGFAADQLTRDMVNFGNTSINFNPKVYFNGLAGVNIGKGNVVVTPALCVKYMSPAPISIEGTVQVEYKKFLYAGITYRNADALVFMAGANISKRFKLGYSYDYNTSKMNLYSRGGHEIILGLMLR